MIIISALETDGMNIISALETNGMIIISALQKTNKMTKKKLAYKEKNLPLSHEKGTPASLLSQYSIPSCTNDICSY